MKKLLSTLLVAVVCLCLAEVSYGQELVIKASPNTVVLDGGSCCTITVHTNLDFDPDYTATINGVPAGTFVDDVGNLVARACIPEEDLSVGEMTVTLVVMDGDDLVGEDDDTITVKEAGPRPQPKTGPGRS